MGFGFILDFGLGVVFMVFMILWFLVIYVVDGEYGFFWLLILVYCVFFKSILRK